MKTEEFQAIDEYGIYWPKKWKNKNDEKKLKRPLFPIFQWWNCSFPRGVILGNLSPCVTHESSNISISSLYLYKYHISVSLLSFFSMGLRDGILFINLN